MMSDQKCHMYHSHLIMCSYLLGGCLLIFVTPSTFQVLEYNHIKSYKSSKCIPALVLSVAYFIITGVRVRWLIH